MFKKIKLFIEKRQKPREMDIIMTGLLERLVNTNNSLDAHLIALCRILFIKPEVLYREVNNNKANAEYILKLLEVKQNEDKKV
jgi:hypothetical protein